MLKIWKKKCYKLFNKKTFYNFQFSNCLIHIIHMYIFTQKKSHLSYSKIENISGHNLLILTHTKPAKIKWFLSCVDFSKYSFNCNYWKPLALAMDKDDNHSFPSVCNMSQNNIIICFPFLYAGVELVLKHFPSVTILTSEVLSDCPSSFGQRYFGTD